MNLFCILFPFIVILTVANSVFAEISTEEEDTPEVEDYQDVQSILTTMRQRQKEGRASLLPPGILPDPFPIPDTVLEFNSSTITGFLSLANASLAGLSTLSDDIQFGVKWDAEYKELLILLNVTIDIGNLSLSAFHGANIRADLEELIGIGILIEVLGNGDIDIDLENLFLRTDLVLRVDENGTLKAKAESLSLSLESLVITAEDFKIIINEYDFPLEDLLELLNLFLPSLLPRLQPLIGDLLTGLLEPCTLADLVTLDLSCTGLFPAQPTTTTERNTRPPTRDIGTNLRLSEILFAISILQIFSKYVLKRF